MLPGHPVPGVAVVLVLENGKGRNILVQESFLPGLNDALLL